MVSITTLLLVAFLATVGNAESNHAELEEIKDDCKLVCEEVEDVMECHRCRLKEEAEALAIAEFVSVILNVQMKQGCDSEMDYEMYEEDMPEELDRRKRSPRHRSRMRPTTRGQSRGRNTPRGSPRAQTPTRTPRAQSRMRGTRPTKTPRAQSRMRGTRPSKTPRAQSRMRGTRPTKTPRAQSRMRGTPRRGRDVSYQFVQRSNKFLQVKLDHLLMETENQILVILEKIIGDCSEQCSELKLCDKDWTKCVQCLRKK